MQKLRECYNRKQKQLCILFIKFDIAEFYPSLSENIRQTALRFAEGHVKITDEEKNNNLSLPKIFAFL